MKTRILSKDRVINIVEAVECEFCHRVGLIGAATMTRRSKKLWTIVLDFPKCILFFKMFYLDTIEGR